jgi:hypothetical protein
MEVLQRNLISLEKIELWANSFIQPDGKDWKDAYVNEDRILAFQNTRNLLRSIYLELVAPEGEMPGQEPLKGIFFNALQNLKSY